MPRNAMPFTKVPFVESKSSIHHSVYLAVPLQHLLLKQISAQWHLDSVPVYFSEPITTWQQLGSRPNMVRRLHTVMSRGTVFGKHVELPKGSSPRSLNVANIPAATIYLPGMAFTVEIYP